MSAWLVFASLGFFPIAGTDEYLLGAPVFERAEIALEGGTLTVECPDPEAPRYTVSLSGEPLAAPSFTHDRIAAGGILRFDAER